MSPVGHSLVGLSLAAIAMPPSRGRFWKTGLLVSFVALANLPDWPIANWGHDRYDISHSIFVNISLIGLTTLVWLITPRLKSSLPLPCFLLALSAWLSHLLLDSFYNHGLGIAIYWPFSDGRLNFAMPWFNTLDLSQSITSQHNLYVYFIEFIAYGPVLILALVVGKILNRETTTIPQNKNAG